MFSIITRGITNLVSFIAFNNIDKTFEQFLCLLKTTIFLMQAYETRIIRQWEHTIEY